MLDALGLSVNYFSQFFFTLVLTLGEARTADPMEPLSEST